MGTSERRTKALFVYACPDGFSGQKRSTEILVENFEQLGWDVETLPLPAYEGTKKSSLRQFARVITGMVVALLRCLRYFGADLIVYLNMGQSVFSMIRISLPLILLRAVTGRSASVVALHGGTFMNWNRNDYRTRLFIFILSRVDKVNVLSPNQKQRLLKLGLDSNKVVVNPNTCTFPAINHNKIEKKHEQDRPVRVMYLGLLIQTKGYFKYLEALELLSNKNTPEIEAVLAGPVNTREGEGVFSSKETTKKLIDKKIRKINSSPSINLVWYNWVKGQQKVDLYHKTHVFVFPSSFSVEAQPHVLMEAMISGCSIITSTTGEIPFQLDWSIGTRIEKPTPERVASAILNHANDEEYRKNEALKGWNHFMQNFSLKVHLKRWKSTFRDLRELISSR